MLDLLKSLFFGEEGPRDTASGDDQARLAAAALLIEAAMADGSLATEEQDRIHLLLRQRFNLPQDAADALYQQASRRQQDTNQLFPFTKTIVDHFDAAQRIELIEMLWEVVYADGRLHDYEAGLVRRVAGLLYVSDQDSGGARQRALARLGIADDPLA